MMNFVVLLVLCLITAILRKSTECESTLTRNPQMVGIALCPVPVPTGMNPTLRPVTIYTLTLS